MEGDGGGGGSLQIDKRGGEIFGEIDGIPKIPFFRVSLIGGKKCCFRAKSYDARLGGVRAFDASG